MEYLRTQRIKQNTSVIKSNPAVEKMINIIINSSGSNYYDMYDRCSHLINHIDYTEMYQSRNDFDQDFISILIEYKQHKLAEIIFDKYDKKGNGILTKLRRYGRDNYISHIGFYMIMAIDEKDYDFVDMLLKYIVDINEPNNIHEDSYLSHAKGCDDIIELLRMHGAV